MKIFISAIMILGCVTALVAQPQQSENFRITKSVLDAGGGSGISENFRLHSAFGQPTPIGLQFSENFVLSAGYLSPLFAVAPLSPIQALVIQPAGTDIKLHWPSEIAAQSYSVYRGADPNFVIGPATFLASTADTFYVDAGVLNLPPIKYYYAVSASNSPPPPAPASLKQKDKPMRTAVK